MKKEMLINVLQSEECRIAIVEDGVLEELYVERASQESYVNNIYKGRIVNIEPSIQAAFVDFGIGRNGFLHVSDVDPVYYKHLEERGGDRGRGRGRGDRDRGDRPDRRDQDRGDRPDRRDQDRGRRPFQPVVIPAHDQVDSLPPEFQEPEPAQQLTGWLEPAAPILDGPVDDFEGGFGAGLDLDESGEAPAAFTQPETSGEQDEAAEMELDEMPAQMTSLSEVLDALPANGDAAANTEEAPAESPRRKPAAKGRGKRTKPESEEAAEPKGRRRGKRKSDSGDETPQGESADSATNDTDDPKPRFMNSAERRTSEDEPEINSTPFGGEVVFDPFAPNDRFNEVKSKTNLRREEPTPAADEAADESAFDDDDTGTVLDERPQMDNEPNEVEQMEADLGDDDDDDLEMDEEFPGSRERGPRGRGDRDRGDRDRGGRGGRGPRRSFGRDSARIKPPIQEIFKRGQEVIVQVIKEGIGTKGPTLSTYISIAGRYLVLMPSLNRLASRARSSTRTFASA